MRARVARFAGLIGVGFLGSLAPACSESAPKASDGASGAAGGGSSGASGAGMAGTSQPPRGGAAGSGGVEAKAGMPGSGGRADGGTTAAGAFGTAGGGNGGRANGGASGGAPLGGSSSGNGASGGAGAPSGGAGGLAQAGSGGVAGASGAAGAGVDAGAMVAAMGFGTNIGNTLENTASWETGWSQPLISEAYIQGMKSHGIKTVRVPVAWDTYASNGTIDATKTARVKEVVGWIIDAGMFAIVNIHWDNGWIDNENGSPPYQLTTAIKTKFAAYWQQIGKAFADVGNELILEGMNEEGRWTKDNMPYGTPDIPPLNEMNQLFVDTVRAQGGANATRALLVAGFNTDIDKTCVTEFQLPTDPAGPGKLFLSLHYYTPYQFTILEDSSAFTTWGTSEDQSQLDGLFTKLAAFSAERKVPVILGEFATTKMRASNYRVAWMTAVAKAALSRGIVPVLWDTGADISRSDGALSSELQSVFSAVKYPN